MSALLCDAAHRPWPAPRSPWVLAMRWHDLLFMHWPVPPESLRPLIPPALDIDTWEGSGWIAVVPFRMSGVRPRFLPPVPGLSSFPELNVRTYVSAGGEKPGVWFFSLDASSRTAVRLARWTWSLPYFHARMSSAEEQDAIRYESRRVHRGAPEARFAARYGPTGDVSPAAPGSPESWWVERYCLYSADRRGKVYRGEIHHRPWPLQPAEAAVDANTMVEPLGLRLPDERPRLHFARRLDVVAWKIRPV